MCCQRIKRLHRRFKKLMSQLLCVVVVLGIKEMPADKVTGLIIIEADLGMSKEWLMVKALVNSGA
jgi:hypothetical protein